MAPSKCPALVAGLYSFGAEVADCLVGFTGHKKVTPYELTILHDATKHFESDIAAKLVLSIYLATNPPNRLAFRCDDICRMKIAELGARGVKEVVRHRFFNHGDLSRS